MKPPPKKMKSVYFSDKVLFNRVDKYLDDNIDKPVIDKEAMVDALRETYVEYKRRNRSAFRASVFKAYDLINQVMSETAEYPARLSTDDPDEVDDVSMDPDDNDTSNMETTSPNRTSPIAYIESVRSMANPGSAATRLVDNTSHFLESIQSDSLFNPNDEDRKSAVFRFTIY
uniref:Nucleolin_bd domain-containing protein n=1 Tax=Rhodnius prolixus TaxID=13249 RepID=T1I218_RHOPR